MLKKQHLSRVTRLLTGQKGFVLPVAVVATLMGAFAVLPVALLVAAQFRSQAASEDVTQDYYVADAAIQAVISDLIRGADIAPLPPNDYVPPTVNIDDVVPFITIRTIEPETAATSTTKAVTYLAVGPPTVIAGADPQGRHGGVGRGRRDILPALRHRQPPDPDLRGGNKVWHRDRGRGRGPAESPLLGGDLPGRGICL